MTGKETRDAYSVDEFCRRHSISIAMFYKLRAQGQTPAEFKAGTRTLVSREAAAAWRAERERAAQQHQRQTDAAAGQKLNT